MSEAATWEKPGAAPGSAASIGGGAAAPALVEAAPAPAAAAVAPSGPATPGAPIGTTGLKECGQEGMLDDGEDGNNQNMPEGNRGGYWYTFRDKKGTTSSRWPAKTAAPSR